MVARATLIIDIRLIGNQMGSYSTYGMAGIGIAAAIGFVFALSMLSANTTINANHAEQEQSGDQQSDYSQSLPMEQEKTAVPSGTDEADDSAGASTLAESSEMPVRQDLSIIALNDNREVIGEVESGMQFVMNKPVFIQANVANPSEVMLQDRFIALAVKDGIYDKSATEYMPQQDEKLASFKGDIAANGTIEVELYWNPERAGTYSILLVSADSIEPVTTILIEVVDSSSPM